MVDPSPGNRPPGTPPGPLQDPKGLDYVGLLGTLGLTLAVLYAVNQGNTEVALAAAGALGGILTRLHK